MLSSHKLNHLNVEGNTPKQKQHFLHPVTGNVKMFFLVVVD